LEDFEANTNERRTLQRIKFVEPVQFQRSGPSSFDGCVAADISEGGIRLNLNDFVPLKTELSMQVHLSDNSVVNCFGMVIWIRKFPFADRYQAGIEFSPGDTIVESKNEIHEYISANQ